jgi:hypothetical protein
MPGRFLYRNHIDTYTLMRVLCTRYRRFVCLGIVLTVVIVVNLLQRPGILSLLRITSPSK